MNTLCVVGSINADLFLHVERHPHPGETLLGTGGEVMPGGKGANQAVAAALQGAQVSFVGAVGDDAYAEPALSIMRSSGVDLSNVTAVPDASTGLAVITLSQDGENSIIVVPGANALVNAEFVTQAPVADADMVLLQGEVPASGFATAVENATGRVVINLAPVIDVPRSALLKADPLIVNEHEAGLVLSQLECPVPETPSEMVEELRAAGFASVVLTLGAAGALAADESGVHTIPTPHITAVDTTGAGDAFTGALCAALLRGQDLVSAAGQAARVGAFAATRRGAQPSYPRLNDTLPEV